MNLLAPDSTHRYGRRSAQNGSNSIYIFFLLDTQQMYSITHSYAELAGRTRPNLHDLEQAFTDMKMSPASLGSYVRRASHSSKEILEERRNASDDTEETKVCD